MLNPTYTRNNGNNKVVGTAATRGYAKQQFASLAFILTICTTPCEGIGSWRKKSTIVEAEDIDSSDTSTTVSNSNHKVDHNMNKTYLDLFGESAKEFLTQKAPEKIKSVFPTTDDSCRWDWRYVRCEPYCECSFQPKLPGDFHLGRACRKRNHLARRTEDHPGMNETENNHFERNSDILYDEYCVFETNYNSDGDNELMMQQRSSPPPPSIPSPFPFLANSGKATWKILRSKTDPVLARAVGEFETIRARVQTVVCQDLKTRCDDIKAPQNEDEREEIGNDSPSTHMEVAWQERLFCRDLVREYRRSISLRDQNNTE